MIINFCPNCYRTTAIQVLADFTDGSQATQFTLCGVRYLSHNCGHHHSLPQPSLLPIAVGAMGVVCKECKLLYQFGEAVAKHNPNAGAAIMAVALLLFGIVALDRLAKNTKR